jgi:arsenate reductase
LIEGGRSAAATRTPAFHQAGPFHFTPPRQCALHYTDGMVPTSEYSSPACSAHEFAESSTDAPLTIYHNPHCSKSRATLELAQAAGVPVRVVEYLKTPPDAAELARLAALLGLAPSDLVRKGEAVFKEKYAGKELSDTQWIEAMVAHPILIERPIVVSAHRAIIGRPPENIRRLLPP